MADTDQNATPNGIHEVVAAVITSDPWCSGKLRPKVLLAQRKPDDYYWPGRWSYITEHINHGESYLFAMMRGVYEELGLCHPRDYIVVRGPLAVEKVDPDHNERFLVQVYNCCLLPLDRREVELNLDENSRYQWFFGNIDDNLEFRRGAKFLCG